RSSRLVMRLIVMWIIKLIGPPVIWITLTDLLAHFIEVTVIRESDKFCFNNLCTVETKNLMLLRCHTFRHDNNYFVTESLTNHSKANTGISGGPLYDFHSWLKSTGSNGFNHHIQG